MDMECGPGFDDYPREILALASFMIDQGLGFPDQEQILKYDPAYVHSVAKYRLYERQTVSD